jgi:hypothetical protein
LIQLRFCLRLEIDLGPNHSLCGRISCPLCPTIGQYFPDRQREQFSLPGNSTVLRSLPYLRLGMNRQLSQTAFVYCD